MYAIFKKNYHFTKDSIAVNEISGVTTRSIEDEWKPSLTAKDYQYAPDWIKETDLFKLGLRDKLIIEVVPVESESEDASLPSDKRVKQPKPSGWGAGQPNGLQS
jgi:hypothetical protein